MSNFRSFGIVDRASENQFQVGENLNKITKRVKTQTQNYLFDITKNVYRTKFLAMNVTLGRPLLWHTCAAGVRAAFDIECTHLNCSGENKI